MRRYNISPSAMFAVRNGNCRKNGFGVTRATQPETLFFLSLTSLDLLLVFDFSVLTVDSRFCPKWIRRRCRIR